MQGPPLGGRHPENGALDYPIPGAPFPPEEATMHDSPSDNSAQPAGNPFDRDPRGQELKPGDRVEALGNFGKPMGTFGTVETVKPYGVEVLWDVGGHMTLGPAWIRKALSEKPS